jgi:O-antigen ligase
MNGARLGTAAGLLLGVFMVAGRWSMSRLGDGEESAMALEPRLWAVALLLAVAFAPHRTGGRVLARRGELALGGWLAFIGYFVVSVAWAPDFVMAGTKALELAMIAGALAAIARLAQVIDPRELSAALWRTLGATLVVFAVLGLDHVGTGERMSVLGGGPNVFGRNMALLATLCIDMLLRDRKRALAGLGLCAAAMLVLLSGSRGAIVALLLATAVLLWGHRVRPTKLLVAALIVVVLVALAVMFTAPGQAAAEMFHERVIRLTLEEEHDSGRSDIYDDAIALGWSAPLYGDGLAGFPARGFFVYPHNLELEAWAEGGLVGVVLLALALWRPIVTLIERPRGVVPLDLAAFVALLGAAQVSGDFFDARGVMIFGLLAVLQHARVEAQVGPEDEDSAGWSTPREHGT